MPVNVHGDVCLSIYLVVMGFGFLFANIFNL